MVRIANVDILQTVIELEYQVMYMGLLVDHLIGKLSPGSLTQQQIDDYQQFAVRRLQAKYPDLDLQWKKLAEADARTYTA